MDELKLFDIHDYCTSHSSAPDQLLVDLERTTHLTTLSPQMISGPYQGLFLEMLSRAVRPARILEVGTFTGYASICLARGLAEGGRLDTIEVDHERERLIRDTLASAGMEDSVHLHIGDAHTIIPGLKEHYDLIFVDAAKREYALFLKLCLPHLSDHGLILFDNTLWSGKVIVGEQDPDTSSIQAFNSAIAQRDDLSVIMLPLRDGLTIVQKRN